ncbi:MAG TPA: glycosyltransferase family 2 protein [Candidatus Andersenbacteria bacterium]|nr:MAG: hypothetical protein A2854_02085 [Parcubacteria group bacterium RIFCSPHIGHO2_01_FULL_56_18]HLD25635.1 glycosyltransferase family 2 protein [Candidatus Andersenbacteria bacterium]
MSSVVIVLPAYNEATVIASVIESIQLQGFTNIVVVDDGSTDGTGAIATPTGVHVVTHKLNRGKGAATKTGIEVAQRLQADIIVTLDADGQHLASDIPAVIQPLLSGACDVVLGTRQWHSHDIPRYKVIHNFLGNAATWLIHHQWVADSQSGFRAYSRHAAKLMDTQADFYDYDSEVIREIRVKGLRWEQVPIRVRYTTYATTKPARQNVVSGLKTAAKMLWRNIS